MLYIVGCSYSADYCWPKFVKYDHINYSEPGAGNKYIYACVDQIPLSSKDSIIVQFSEVERIDLVLDKNSAFNQTLQDVPSIRQRELKNCIAWCTAGPRGAWNNNPVGKRYLVPLMREYYSEHSQKIEPLAWIPQVKKIVQDSGARSLYLTLQDLDNSLFQSPPMNKWAHDNGMLDDDEFHLSHQGNLDYYNSFISEFVNAGAAC